MGSNPQSSGHNSRMPARSTALDLAPVALVVAASVAFVGVFYGFFAYLPDDGAYAWVAERLLAGDVLHRDVQDVHAGYINFANAFAMRLFGISLGALRVPLAVMTVVQSVLVFCVLRRTSIHAAIVGAVAFTTLTAVQFLNPSANWYSLFGSVVCIAFLSFSAPDTRFRYAVIGLLVGTVFLTRQLSGVILGIGVLTFLCYELDRKKPEARGVVARATLVPLVAALGFYAYTHTDFATFILYALWPIAIGTMLGWTARISNRQAFSMLAQLVLGALVSALPLIAYHVAHDSLFIWLEDSFSTALSLAGSGFISEFSFSRHFLLIGLYHVATLEPVKMLSGFFWAALIVAPFLLGLNVISALRRNAELPSPALVIVATFYALTSLHYQIPIYVFYSAALTLTALVVVVADPGSARRRVSAAVAIFLCAIAAWHHAAQPLRPFVDTLTGQKTQYGVPCEIDRIDVRIEPATCATYQQLLALIDRHAAPDDPILALPVNPELYFLSRRNPPVRFYNSTLGLARDDSVGQAIADLRKRPPALVFFRPDDKYTSARTRQLMDWIRSRYRLIEIVDGFETYLPLRGQSGSGSHD